MSHEPQAPKRTDGEQQPTGQPELPPIHQVVQDMVEEAVAERPVRDAESRANFERAGRKEQP